MNAHAGRVHILPTAERLDVEAAALIRQQTAECTVLNTAIDTFIATVTPLTFPLGPPTRGYDVESILATAEEMRPTQTERQMAERTEELDAERRGNVHEFWGEVLGETT